MFMEAWISIVFHVAVKHRQIMDVQFVDLPSLKKTDNESLFENLTRERCESASSAMLVLRCAQEWPWTGFSLNRFLWEFQASNIFQLREQRASLVVSFLVSKFGKTIVRSSFNIISHPSKICASRGIQILTGNREFNFTFFCPLKTSNPFYYLFLPNSPVNLCCPHLWNSGCWTSVRCSHSMFATGQY